jgi:polysaccharide transporter, PST family
MGMSLFRTSFWTSLSAICKVIATYVLWKVVAVFTGPAGMALMEQFQNFLQISRSAILCGINQGVVKYIAEYKLDYANKSRIITNSLLLNAISCILITGILVAFDTEIARFILKSSAYSSIIDLTAASAILFSLNIFCLSILNGEMEIKKYVLSVFLNTMLAFLIPLYFIVFHGLYAGVASMICNQALIAFFTLWMLVKTHTVRIRDFFGGIDGRTMLKLLRYSLMVFAPTLTIPVSLIIVRKFLVFTLSWQEAGYWQGMTRLSMGCWSLMDMVFSVYYIPKLSSIKSMPELKMEIIQGYKLIFPLLLLGAITVYLLRQQIIILLFNRDFLPMAGLFKYQLCGDIARAGTWLLTNMLLARAVIKTYILTETFFSLSYALLSIIFIHYYGLAGASIGFAVNYILYWLWMIIYSIWYLGGDRITTAATVSIV